MFLPSRTHWPPIVSINCHTHCTSPACRLHVRLSKPLAGNVLLVKLVSQENLMQLFHDQHDWPNVDMAYVGLKGKVVNLPPGISLAL